MPPDNSTQEIGALIRSRRKELGLTQRDVAELTGVGLNFIHDLENGKPTVQFGKALAVASTLGLELTFSRNRER